MLLPMILWQLFIALTDVPTLIVSYWLITDVIAKDYDYSFFSQLAEVIVFIVCGRCKPHVKRYCLLDGRWNGHILQQLTGVIAS